MREPKEVVRLAYRAFSCGDWETARAAVDPKVAWSVRRGRPEVDPYADRVGATGLLSFWASVFRLYRVRPQEFIPHGDRVVVPLDLYGRGGRIDATTHVHEVWSVLVTDGRISSVDEFASLDEAIQA